MKTSRLSQLAVPIGVVAIVVMLVVPMPATLLDILIAGNITGAVLVVLVSMYVQRALDFSSFPSLLLVATLFRLALNISATRLVLTDGFAGHVISAFGHFVIGGSLVIGLVIFAILLVIQFVVITNGAGRVAEVGARFTLDAMPGKQMAIDADLNAGLIDESTARKRRSEIAAEADFYGAMDGATRFVKGDAIAAIMITFINLIGGFVIGMVQHHLTFGQALSKYSLLSVGDGLVSQIPALLLSVSTGLIVTRSSDADDMGTLVSRQLGSQRRALTIAAGAALLLCLVPGLPKLPFIVVGGMLFFFASRLPKPGQADEAGADGQAVAADAPGSRRRGDAARRAGRGPAGAGPVPRPGAPRGRPRRRPARPRPGAAALAGRRAGRGHARGAHARQRDAAARHLRGQHQRRRAGPRRGPRRHGPRYR